MPTEAGEYIVGAYLQEIERCGIILYNVRPPGGGLAGLRELDVIGLNLPEKKAFLCEVTTHLYGMRPQIQHNAQPPSKPAAIMLLVLGSFLGLGSVAMSFWIRMIQPDLNG